MWFAFKFYLWQRSYKLIRLKQQHLMVVICFQILSLTTFLQEPPLTEKAPLCCDLLSNFIFDNVLTSVNSEAITHLLLWFAFKFYLWQRSYKCKAKERNCSTVVICFQILSLTTFLQVFSWSKLYSEVVICFQILSLTTFLQGIKHNGRELLVVICFQILSLTTFLQEQTGALNLPKVVICFQILSLTTFLQAWINHVCPHDGCDLLSNFIFDNVLTSRYIRNHPLSSCDLLSNFIFDNVLTRATCYYFVHC